MPHVLKPVLALVEIGLLGSVREKKKTPLLCLKNKIKIVIILKNQTCKSFPFKKLTSVFKSTRTRAAKSLMGFHSQRPPPFFLKNIYLPTDLPQASTHISFLDSVLPPIEQNYVVKRDKKQQKYQLNFSGWFNKNILSGLR